LGYRCGYSEFTQHVFICFCESDSQGGWHIL
jgi:hypothetical protein